MKFFNQLDESSNNKIFYKRPEDFYLDSPKELLSYALGATMYMPAIRENIAKDFINFKHPALKSCVLCMEDAIDDSDEKKAWENLFLVLKELETSISNKLIDSQSLPMIFIRIRDLKSFERLIKKYKKLSLICGFVFPKFDSNNSEKYLNVLSQVNSISDKKFYGLPILESSQIIYKESRVSELVAIKNILDRYKDIVLNIRIGAADLSGLYSLRREFAQTIYDIAVINNCIADIINMFLRADSEYVVSGPVWEYFRSGDRLLKPLLRETAFFSEMGKEGLKERSYLIDQYADGLIKETLLDKANGLTGKTIIHPTHISIVNALQVVTKEEYEDAKAILDRENKGAAKSIFNNKMNEPKPHINWARKILTKSKIYGVLNEGRNYTSLFTT